MISWLRKIDSTIIALIVGPALIVIGIVGFRHQLWGPTLEELRVLSRKHDRDLQSIAEKQDQILAAMKVSSGFTAGGGLKH